MSSLFKTFSPMKTMQKISGKRKTINDLEIDLNKIAPQELDPRTLKPITEVVMQSDQFIVTIDEALSINWMTNGKYKHYATDFSAVTAKVQLLSAQIHQLFANKSNRYRYKKIIAEALALVLHEKKSDNAFALLKNVENKIKEYGKERVRMAYIFYAFFTALFVIVLLGISVQNKNSSWLFAGDIKNYQLSVATLLGGIGAFISVFIRFKNYEGNIIAGLSTHRLDGLLRVLYGCIAALILSLAIYSNTILGFLNTTSVNQSWAIYFLAAIAGATEFLIPNLIRNTKTARDVKSKLLAEEKEDEDSYKNKTTEKTIMIYKNQENGNDDSTQHEQNDEFVKEQEEEIQEEDSDTLMEKTDILYKNENNDNDWDDEYGRIPQEQNEESVKIQEEEIGGEEANNKILYEQNEGSVEMKQEEIQDEDGSTLTEKTVALYEDENCNNNHEGENDKIPYIQNEEPVRMQEEDTTKNILTEKPITIYENDENEDDENDKIQYKQNEEPGKMQEEDAGRNTLLKKPLLIYENEKGEKEDEENDKIPHKQNEEPGKTPVEIKIARQLVQGKINLEDY